VTDATLKDINYFNENPEELPEDQDYLDKLLAGESIPTKTDLAAAAKAEADKDADATGEVEGATDTDSKEAKADTDEAKGSVETPSGKGRIPYAVLKGAREKAEAEAEARQEAEKRAADAEAQATALRDRIAALEKVDKPADSKAVQAEADDIAEAITALKEDLPGMAGILEKLYARTTAAEERANRLEGHIAKSEKADEAVLVEESQRGIDENPHLALWQNTSHSDKTALAAWQAAYDVDQQLSTDAYWGKKPLAERFEKVVKEVLERVPDAPVPKLDDKDGDTKPGQTEAERQAALKAAKEAADKGGRGTVTLSDAKGGSLPAADALGDIESLSAQEIQAALDKMTPKQQQEYLDRFS